MAEYMNWRHHASRRAQKDAMMLFQVFYFSEHDDDATAEAIVYSIRKNSMLVHIPQFSLKGTVFLLGSDGSSIVPTLESRDEMFPTTNISIDIEKQFVKLIFPSKSSPPPPPPRIVFIKAFDKIRVHIGTEQSRSHKPDIRLKIVSFPEEKEKSTSQEK